MLSKLFPKEFDFFKLFSDSAALGVKAAECFEELVKNPAKHAEEATKIHDAEKAGDEITHKTMTLLHKTFITPIDRQDIHDLIKRLDDILDFIDAAAARVVLYELDNLPASVIDLARVNLQSARHVRDAVAGLVDLKHPQRMNAHCVEINRLENEADQIMRQSLAILFKEETDLKRLIKLKELFELLETVSDCCEDVANVVESIILEYA